MAPRQLKKSTKKWNEESNLEQWNDFYYEDNYNGNRLRAREKKLLQLLDKVGLSKNARVLELGYGAGVTSAKILARSFSVVGIDISEKLRHIAVKNCQNIKNTKGTFKFEIGNAENLHYEDNSFDCVVGLGFLQYLEFPDKCLKESLRVLKPGGYCIIGQRNMFGVSSNDDPLKWIRSLTYLITNSRYELRWQNTPLIYPILGLTKLFSPFSKYMRKAKVILQDHRRIGKIGKNAWCYSRLTKLFSGAGFKVVGSSGAGFLSRKYKLFPSMFHAIDRKLQKKNDSGKKWIRKFGNSVVIVGKK